MKTLSVDSLITPWAETVPDFPGIVLVNVVTVDQGWIRIAMTEDQARALRQTLEIIN